MSGKPIFFYSRNNRNCIQLWEKLSKENKLNNFIKICVDNNNKIPRIVTTVPSFYLKGRPLIHGNAINLFLNSNNRPAVNSAPNNNIVTNINNPPGKVPDSNSSTNGLGGINDFNPIEMSNKWSDAYSFIQNNPTPMEFTYQFIQKDDSTNNSQINHNNNLRKKGSQLDQRLEKLQMERSQLNNNMMRRK